MMRQFWGRLTTRLSLMAFAAAMPLLVTLLYLQANERDEELERAVGEHRRTVLLAADNASDVFRDAERLVGTLALMRELSEADRRHCPDVLHRVIVGRTDVLNLVLATQSGELICSARPLDLRVFPQAQSGVREVRRSDGVAIGNPVVAATNGHLTVVVAAALDVPGPDGRSRRVGLSIDLSSISRSFAASDLPSGGVLSLLDRTNAVVANYPADSSDIGVRVPLPGNIALVLEAEGLYEESHADGPLLVVPVRNSAGSPTGYHVVLTVDRHAAVAAAQARWQLYMGLIGIAMAAALWLVTLAGQRLIMKPTLTLARQVRRLAAGDFSARVAIRGGLEGMAELGDALNEMATAIAQRQQERDHAAEDLRRSKEKSEQLFEQNRFALEAAEVGVWESNLVSGVSYWSETNENMHGLPPGGFGGTFEAFMESIEPSEREAAQKEMGSAMREMRNADLEYHPALALSRRLRSVGRFFYDTDGRPVRGAGVTLDITERWRLEEQVRHSQKLEAVGQLAGGVAHDFNNLLTIIAGNAEFAMGTTQEAGVRQDLQEIKAAAQRATKLTRQLLSFSRKQLLTVVHINVDEMMKALMPMMSRLIEADIKLEYLPCDGSPSVLADRDELEHAIINLVVNARDAQPNGGAVQLEVKEIPNGASSTVSIAVRDHGSGMPPHVIERAFEPFFTTKPAGKGTGLGLASVYGTIKQAGGDVTIDSAPGRGTCVTLLLPAVDRQKEACATTTTLVPKGGKETVLLVEDQDGVRHFAARALREAGYSVLEASDAAEAMTVSSAYAGDIALLFSDVVMPGMSIADAIEKIRECRPTIGLLLTSGYPDAEARRRIGSMDADLFAKPYSIDELLTRVADAITRRGRVRRMVA